MSAATPLPVPRAELAESPCWDQESGRLLWVDIPAGRVHRLTLSTHEHEATEIGQPVGAVVTRAGGGLALAARDGFLALGREGGQPEQLAAVEADLPGNRLNDGKCDRAGRFFAGSKAEDDTPGAGALYRFDPDHRVTRLLSGVTISNGIGWSPDERRLYYVDSPTGRIDQFDYQPATGTLTNRRDFARIPAERGIPDGLTVDAEGGVWVALWGGAAVRRYAVDGGLLGEFDLPTTWVTSCCFGGPDLDQLYVTTARGEADDGLGGSVFVLDPGVAGLPAQPFRG